MEEKKNDQNTMSRPERVYSMLTNPSTKLYCLFVQAAMPVFNNMNLLLQKDEPMVHVIHSRCLSFLTDLLVRFIKPHAITRAKDLFLLDFSDRSIQKAREDIVIGSKAKEYLEYCKEHKVMTSEDRTEFFDCVRKYYATAANYIVKKFPLEDQLLQKAYVADITRRTEAKFGDLLFFTKRFPSLMPDEAAEDQLEIQFSQYQVDPLAAVSLNQRIDECWHNIGQLQTLDSSLLKYGLLAHVMLGILVIPHSNADSERIFSSVRRNQTEFRPNIGVPLLESLMITKTQMQSQEIPVHRLEFTPDFLSKAKSATTKALKPTDKQSEGTDVCRL